MPSSLPQLPHNVLAPLQWQSATWEDYLTYRDRPTSFLTLMFSHLDTVSDYANPNYRELVQMEADFDSVRSDERFRAVVEESS
jgi:hypothetical protein